MFNEKRQTYIIIQMNGNTVSYHSPEFTSRRVADVEWTRKHGNANVMHFEHFKTGLL